MDVGGEGGRILPKLELPAAIPFLERIRRAMHSVLGLMAAGREDEGRMQLMVCDVPGAHWHAFAIGQVYLKFADEVLEP